MDGTVKYTKHFESNLTYKYWKLSGKISRSRPSLTCAVQCHSQVPSVLFQLRVALSLSWEEVKGQACKVLFDFYEHILWFFFFIKQSFLLSIRRSRDLQVINLITFFCIFWFVIFLHQKILFNTFHTFRFVIFSVEIFYDCA